MMLEACLGITIDAERREVLIAAADAARGHPTGLSWAIRGSATRRCRSRSAASARRWWRPAEQGDVRVVALL